jgi:ankyrin repeat protein
VEDYLDAIEEMSRGLLDRVVNLTDVNGNTALHYSVSHGNFDVVSILLDSKVGNANILNKAGYTCIMLISLAPILNDTHRAVVCRLFSMGDVNIRATQHGQTALMLAASHGRLDMVQLLVGAGADINIRDEDGSTALMCAAEHGHSGIVKYLLQNPDTDVLAKDNDGLTALAVAMEAGHRDLGVLLYANTSLSRGASPYSSVRIKKPQSTSTSHSRTASPSTSNRTPTSRTLIPVPSTGTPKAPTTPTPPQRTRRNSLNQ